MLNISQYQNGTSPSVGQPCLATHSGYACLRLQSIEIDYMEYGHRLASAFTNSTSVPRHHRCPFVGTDYGRQRTRSGPPSPAKVLKNLSISPGLTPVIECIRPQAVSTTRPSLIWSYGRATPQSSNRFRSSKLLRSSVTWAGLAKL